MNDELKIKMYSFTVDCKEPHELAKFYAGLLKWEIMLMDEEYACVYAPEPIRGHIRVSYFNRILNINRLYGRKNRKLNSKWHIWTSPLMI